MDGKEFIATDEKEKERIISFVENDHWPAARNKPLGFGCGVGRLMPMSMTNLPETKAMSILKNAGTRVASEKMVGKALESRTSYVTQYCALLC